ncbi:MAG: HEAT repeat domain-containing protein [Bryobacterales bacterium]|nr:HEAT repeat domain-containing protein [Bryobacterales bacterium]
MKIITAAEYNSTSVYDLLCAAAKGHIGIDQRLLRTIVDRGEAAMDELVRFGMEERSDDRINLDDDLVALIQYSPSAKALPYLVELLRLTPVDPPEDLAHAFLRIGEDAIGPLLRLYFEVGAEEGGDIAFILASFRQRDPRILKMLKERAAVDPGDAAFLMGVHGDPAAVPLLEDLKKQALVNEKLAGELGEEAEESLRALAAVVDEDPVEPVSLWDIYPEHIEPVFEVMPTEEKLAFLRSSSAEYRGDCATSYIDREIPDEVAEVLYDLAKDDPNVGVRAICCTALGGRIEDPKVVDLLLERLEDTKRLGPERCGALIALAPKAKTHTQIAGYIDEFYKNPGTKARAMEAMWRSLDKQYADVFRQHMKDSDYDVRRQAIKGAGFLDLTSEAPKILEYFQDEEFRLDALFAYAMCAPAKVQRGEMPKLLKKIDNLAGGLSDAEGEVVETALDTRLVLHGLEPVFLVYDEDEEEGA